MKAIGPYLSFHSSRYAVLSVCIYWTTECNAFPSCTSQVITYTSILQKPDNRLSNTRCRFPLCRMPAVTVPLMPTINSFFAVALTQHQKKHNGSVSMNLFWKNTQLAPINDLSTRESGNEFQRIPLLRSHFKRMSKHNVAYTQWN